ncbi:MAG: MFS transporter, partial [Leptolyngbyaceae cyanobacterium]
PTHSLTHSPTMTHPSPPATTKLPLSAKLAFGAGDMGAGLTANLVVFSFLAFLINVAGVSPGLAGTVVSIGKFWDAFTDPMVGFLSDRTQSRWGRRHSWMLFGSIPFGLSFALMWVVPPVDNPTFKFAYYVVISLLFFATYTVVNPPYAALTPELTQDYDERTNLNSFRLSFSLGGAVFGLVLGWVINQVISDGRSQHLTLGIIGAVIATLPLYWCIWGTRPHLNLPSHSDIAHSDTAHSDIPSPNIPASGITHSKIQNPKSEIEPPPLSFFQQLKIALSNRPFLYVIGIYLLSWLALQVTASNIPFFVQSWMGLEDYFLVALLVQGCAIPMLFVCDRLCKKLGKRGLYFWGMGFWMIIQSFLFFLHPGQTRLLYFLALCASFGVATAYIVPWSMLPDVIELDELETGERREGVFYSFMTSLQKIGYAAGIFVVSQALEQSGFVAAIPGEPLPDQLPSALFAIRLVIGPFPTLCLIGGVILAYFYPITRDRHAAIVLQLQERANANATESSDLD